VEHFSQKSGKVNRVVSYLNQFKPDVFALLEVTGKEVFDALVKKMPEYQFHITEGRTVQEILIGVKQGFTAFFTQKTEFNSGIQTIRPGALLTLTIDKINYCILFLHTKSSSLPLGLGIRDDQFSRAFKFKQKLMEGQLKKGINATLNYLFLGDFNVMGMIYPYKKEIEAPFEIKKLEDDAKKVGMRRLLKDKPCTWRGKAKNKIAFSDLDQVVAAGHLKFKKYGNSEVTVKGWPELSTKTEQDDWNIKYSDHGLIYLEVVK
jgi:hypothetical protein